MAAHVIFCVGECAPRVALVMLLQHGSTEQRQFLEPDAVMLGQGDIGLDGKKCARAVCCDTFKRKDPESFHLAEATEDILHFLPFHEDVVYHLVFWRTLSATPAEPG